MAIEKGELSATVVEIGMDIILLATAASLAVIECHTTRSGSLTEDSLNLLAGTGSVDMLVKAIVKKIVAMLRRDWLDRSRRTARNRFFRSCARASRDKSEFGAHAEGRCTTFVN